MPLVTRVAGLLSARPQAYRRLSLIAYDAAGSFWPSLLYQKWAALTEGTPPGVAASMNFIRDDCAADHHISSAQGLIGAIRPHFLPQKAAQENRWLGLIISFTDAAGA